MTGGRRPHGPRPISTRSLHALFVVRLLLIANGTILSVVGVLYALFGERPAGLIVGAALGALAVTLFACLPLTNPERRR